MKVGFIGLGNMGAAIAANLVRAKHEVIVWNRTAAKTGPLVEAGATLAASPKGGGAGTRGGTHHAGRRCGAGGRVAG
jgi:3-hydroxyisobutyrate dehydrogenase-like beta-hydroxyacid dehydrogenase